MRVTPAARARPTSSATGGSHESRWQWVSITAGASGDRRLGLDPAGRAARARRPWLRPPPRRSARSSSESPGRPSAASRRSAEPGMKACSSTDTTRRPSASAYSTWSRCSASASSFASFQGSSSCTYRLSRLIRRQTSSSAAVSSTSSIRARTASTRPSNSDASSAGASAVGHDAVAVALDHRERAAGEVAVLVGELGVVPRLEPLGRDLAVGPEAHLTQHVEAERVGAVDVGHVEGLDHVAERLRHLVLAEQQVAVDGHLLRHLDVGRHQQRRPDDRVELEDVLADQVDRRRPELVGEVLALRGRRRAPCSS